MLDALTSWWKALPMLFDDKPRRKPERKDAVPRRIGVDTANELARALTAPGRRWADREGGPNVTQEEIHAVWGRLGADARKDLNRFLASTASGEARLHDGRVAFIICGRVEKNWKQ